jgi:hypothetical protein
MLKSMRSFKELIEKEKEIIDFENKTKKFFFSIHLFFNSKLKKKKNEHLINIQKYLEENNNEFRSLIIEQYQILKDKNITFKTQATRNAMFLSNTTKFVGKLHSNGYAYMYPKKGEVAIMAYPSAFVGKIDYLGNIEFEASGSSSGFLKTLPEIMSGNLSDYGEFELKTTKVNYDIGSNKIVIKIIGRIFNNDNESIRFDTNMKRLNKIIIDFKNEINTTANSC